MFRTILHFAVIAATLLLTDVRAEVISRLPMLHNLAVGAGTIPVDCVANVNFWYAKTESLFVQDEGAATYVKLPKEFYRKGLDLKPGTRIRIKGQFDCARYIIVADDIEVLGTGKPVVPEFIAIDAVNLEEYWSQRVSFVAVAESALINDDSVELVMQKGTTRIFLRRFGVRSAEEVESWIGSRVMVTGTLVFELERHGRPGSCICHSMEEDRFEIQSSDSERQLTEVSGQIGFVNSSGMISVEKDDGTVSSVYAPFRHVLRPGDHVEIRASKTQSLVDESFSGPLFPGDCQGFGCTFRSVSLVRTGSGRLSAPVRITSKTLISNSMLNKRVAVSGDVLDVVDADSFLGKKLIRLTDRGRAFSLEVDADQRALNDINLHLDSRLSVIGAIGKLDKGDGEFTVLVDSLDAIRVHETFGHFPKSTAIALVVGVTCLIVGGLLVFWHLRSQVSNREQDLAQVIARLNSTYGAIREAILVFDDRGAVVGANSRVKKILGLDPEHLNAEAETDGRTPLANLKRRLGNCFADRKLFEQLWDKVESDNESVHSLELSTSDDSARTLIVYTAPVDKLAGYSGARIWTFDDVTDRKLLEANLLQSQKMEAIGCLAGGVAHDFNNLLMAMTANLELARLNPKATVGESDGYLVAVEESAHRAAKLIKHLLGFSRKASLDMKVVNPNDVIVGMKNLLQRTLDIGVSLKMNLQEDPGNIRADATQLEQVLLNICLNARDSFGGSEGTIEIETSAVPAANLPACVPGKSVIAFDEYVCIQICDNGSGMSAEVQERIYEPFFTTKDPNKGTGLGLAMSFGIIEQHNGFIHCRSEAGLGTQFQLLLPKVNEKAEQLVPGVSLPISVPEKGHVLLADDNTAVGQSTANALRAHGFSVTVVTDGKQAVDFVQSNLGAALVAILDLAMPVMSGDEALKHIVSIDPNLPVILYSGYLDEFSGAFRDASALPYAILQKPFRMHELIELVSAAIMDHQGSPMSVS